MFLNHYYRIGAILFQLRHILVLLLIAALVATVWVMFASVELSERYLLPSMVASAWLILCLTAGYHSQHPLPQVQSNCSGWQRWKTKLVRGVSFLLAVTILVCSLLLFWFSTTTLRLFLNA